MRKYAFSAAALILLPLCLAPSLHADESMEDLLKSYRKEADLSKQTKKENAGFVTVYTRDDLERMQVYRLSDLIKSMWFFRYDLNSFGMPDPLQKNPVFYSSDSIKIYVNDHEITSGFSGSGLQFYGNVDMGMFDHVEIYYDSPVLDVATEPAIAVIKLYTKEPERENGGSLVMRLADRGSQEAYVSHAMVFDTWEYFAYAQESENYFKHDQHLGSTLSKNYRQQHLFFDLQREGDRFEFEYLNQKHDPFTAQSTEITPTGGYWKMPVLRASYSGEWFNRSFHTDLSYIHSTLEMDMRSRSLFWGQIYYPFAPSGDPSDPFNPDHPFNPGSWIPGPDGQHHFALKGTGDLFTTKIYKDWKWGEHFLKCGVEYRYKAAKTDKMVFNQVRNAQDKAHFNIGSFYLQDQVSLFGNAMLSLSFKYNYYDLQRRYDGESNDDSLDTWQGRIAYSFIRDNWHFKTFLTHNELSTQLFELLLHDAQLDSQKLNTLSMETKYIDDADQYRVVASGSNAQDVNIVNWSVTEGNRVESIDLNIFNAVFEASHNFSDNHRLDFNFYYTHLNKSFDGSNKNYTGGMFRLLDTFDNLDLFNELIFRQKTTGVDEGWDYNAGLKYHLSKDLTLAIKGVNILDKAKKTKYYTLRLPDLRTQQFPNATLGDTVLPVVERQVYFSLEWLF
ncbi:hypothetical protein [Hydrogenimonas urashimensis]|uniref:hypothetical protein n=1 Tax=Hydrogenimonas urashimensis TaxID=2740515 RepID=UPI001914F15D|nr:hypothetical protein [Hydrogenimonas urashimensis]